ncbi:MAG: chloramphenicol acetyltransferase [Pseudomonadota bacterium]
MASERLGDAPSIAENCTIENSEMGRYVRLGEGTRLLNSRFGDYSYTDRYCDIANAEVGKFANIASYARIGPTDHPMDRASLHHFLYRSALYWEAVEDDVAFFEQRRSRRTVIGHDTWIGHMAVIRPEVTVGHGAVVGMGALVTKDVAPYTIVVGNPARPMRQRHPPKTADRLMAIAWWDWDHERLREALPDFRALSAEAFLEKYGG